MMNKNGSKNNLNHDINYWKDDQLTENIDKLN